MKRQIFVVVGLVLCSVAGLTAQNPPPVKQIQSRALVPSKAPKTVIKSTDHRALMANQTPNVFDQGYKYQKGLSGSNYKLTGEIWGVAIGDNSDEADYSQAGFYTSGIQNTGTSPFHGVTVTAVVQIISITGKVQFAVALYSAEGFMPWIYTFSTPGTYTLVTQPEELPPNKVHQGFTYMICSPETANTPTGCYAKVVSIKVNLGSQ